MQYNASRGQPAMIAPAVKSLNLGARSASHTYGVDTPPRTASTDSDMPGWANMPPPPRPGGGPPSAFGSNKDIARRSARHSRSRSDVVSRHLLVETALLDSQNFEMLTIQEVDALKKERTQLESKLESTRRKLALESKVRDAAQSLHRLYADDNKGVSLAPPTQVKKRPSFQKPFGGSGNTQKHAGQAGDELVESQKKVDNLLQILSGLESRRQYVESRLLRHTAAVLQQNHETRARSSSRADTPSEDPEDYDQNLIDNTISGLLNGPAHDERMRSRELHKRSASQSSLRGRGQRQSSAARVPDERLVALQSQIDGMNSQMRSIIQLVRGDQISSDDEMEPRSVSRSGDAVAYLETQVNLVNTNLRRLEAECQKVHSDREMVTSHLGETTKQLQSLVQLSGFSTDDYEVREPPSPETNHMSPVLEYLDEAALALQGYFQASKNNEATDEDKQRTEEYQNTVEGLWEIITSTIAEKEPFSLPAFSTRVQHMFDKAAKMDVQTDILRRQIQQQRELNTKSDGEKAKQIEEAQAARANAEEELEALREIHAATEMEAQASREEMDKVIEEMEQIRIATKANEEQKQAVLDQLGDHKSRAAELEAMITEYETQIAELQDDMRLTAAEAEGQSKEHETNMSELRSQLTAVRTAHDEATAQLNAKHQESADSEAEMIRLTTELAMVKAELDGAYGSRAERAKESTTAELESLRREKDVQAERLEALTSQIAELKSGGGRVAQLEKELRGMADELAGLTADSVAGEREREQLESLVEGLRARCETLEAQLTDERVRWLGVKSPSVVSPGEKEQTSAMVLRNEFKKMMRETRAENAKALRAEQEERKKLEAVIKSMKKEKEAKGGLTVKP